MYDISNKPSHNLSFDATGEYRVENFITAKIEENSVDCIVTSPPYGVGKDYGTDFNDNMNDIQYINFTENWGQKALSMLKPGCLAFINIGANSKTVLRPFKAAVKLEEIGFQAVQVLIWQKQDEFGGQCLPINGNKFVNFNHEYIFVFAKRGARWFINREVNKVPYLDSSNIERYGRGSNLRCRGTVITIPYKGFNLDNLAEHPCIFPIALPKFCIELAGLKNNSLVLDPFSGSGSTAVAVGLINKESDVGYKLRFLCFDLSEEYANVAEIKYDREVNPTQTFIDSFF